METLRSLPAERFDHLDRAWRRRHLVDVVAEREHEVARELRPQCFADQGREPASPCCVFGSGSGPSGRHHRVRRVDGETRHAQS